MQVKTAFTQQNKTRQVSELPTHTDTPRPHPHRCNHKCKWVFPARTDYTHFRVSNVFD